MHGGVGNRVFKKLDPITLDNMKILMMTMVLTVMMVLVTIMMSMAQTIRQMMTILIMTHTPLGR